MKHLLIVLLAALVTIGCGNDDNSQNSLPTYGKIKLEVFDSPPPADVEEINLTVYEVLIHRDGSGWQTIAEVDTTIDFLELVNGTTVVMVDDSFLTGHYTQARFVLADTNEIVVAGHGYPLIVPSGSESGLKFNLDFTLNEDEEIEVCVDFDISKAIVVSGMDDYKLHPVFHAFIKEFSGTISGIVTDTLGVGVENALVEASDSSYSSSALTDSAGSYLLMLPFGTYDLQASANGYSVADTSYRDVILDVGNSNLTGFDFTLE